MYVSESDESGGEKYNEWGLGGRKDCYRPKIRPEHTLVELWRQKLESPDLDNFINGKKSLNGRNLLNVIMNEVRKIDDLLEDLEKGFFPACDRNGVVLNYIDNVRTHDQCHSYITRTCSFLFSVVLQLAHFPLLTC